MLRKLMLGILLALALATPPLHADNLPPLTNDSILQMLNGIGEEQVIKVIQGNNTNFDLTPAAIKALSQSGVSQNVLAAMFSANLRSSAAATAPGDAVGPAPAAAPQRQASEPRRHPQAAVATPAKKTPSSPQAADSPQAGAVKVAAQVATPAAPPTPATVAPAAPPNTDCPNQTVYKKLGIPAL
jgi:hypothetical protein